MRRGLAEFGGRAQYTPRIGENTYRRIGSFLCNHISASLCDKGHMF